MALYDMMKGVAFEAISHENSEKRAAEEQKAKEQTPAEPND